MTEPLDPAVLGVASALETLRTRSGLREERLRGTDLPLDTLTGLDSVRVLIHSGQAAERAIVSAVRAAAGTLEPTMSIVADASLGLEMFAGQPLDGDLYAENLGQRRAALLRNWGQLHQLRSVPASRPPSPGALRLKVEAAALAALAMALTTGATFAEPAAPREPGGSVISPEELRLFGADLAQTLLMRGKTTEEAATDLAVPAAEVAQWAAGEELPSKQQARELDEYLTAQGAISKRVTELRSGPDYAGARLVPVPFPSPSAPTLMQMFQGVAAALRHCLSTDADGRPTGWSPDLRVPGDATATSTAFGIRTMLLLEDGLAADLIPVADSLRKMAFSAGGYAGREQYVARPEATAAVVNALRRVAATEDFDAHKAQMERDLGDFEKCRPFILATMLETSLLLDPGTVLVETLVDSLLAARRPYGDLLLWPEKAEPFRSAPAPSVAHTARAVRVLASVQAVRPAGHVRETLEQAVPWLMEQRDLHNAYEVIERQLNDRLEAVHVRHFTSAWVVKALVSAGVPTSHPAVSSAVAQIWDSYDGTAAGLWAWDNGDQPIWMTFDAIEALRLASLAVPARPAWSPPS
jgi:hypothetical protein